MSTPKSVSLLKLFLILNAFIWIYLGFRWMWRYYDNYLFFINGSIFFMNAFMILCLAVFLKKGSYFVYYFGIAYIFTNIFLTITDQFGIYDLIILILESLAIYYFYQSRKFLLHKK